MTERYIEENGYQYKIMENEEGKIVSKFICCPDFVNINTPSEPTQLDRIESMVSKSQEQIAQEARDAYTLELIKGGVIA